MIKWFISYLTMKRGHCLFVDVISGEEVYEYHDKYGDRYLAGYNKYGFRVKINGELKK